MMTAAAKAPVDYSAQSAGLSEVRRLLTTEVKLRQAVIKPLDTAMRALKDPHKNAVVLHEAALLLEQPNEELALPNSYNKLVQGIRALADEKLADLEFTFARDLREAFAVEGLKLNGAPAELIADLFVIKPDLRKRQVTISFSRQAVTKGAVKLDVERVVTAYLKARKEICERKVDYAAFLGELYEAYQRTLKLSGKPTGARQPIVDCYRELVLVRQPLGFRKTPSKSSFLDYPKAQFAYDMLQLRRSNKLTHEGHRLNLGTATIDIGADTTKAMFLATGATEGAFIKDLYFAAEK
ncbi:MAG: hypothetical protein HOP19_07065 [Acidobacteria bacterium]|nr:hypothetical protein [Acidobacteriota bacterium]